MHAQKVETALKLHPAAAMEAFMAIYRLLWFFVGQLALNLGCGFKSTRIPAEQL